MTEWKKVEDADVVKFDDEGQSVEGKYLGVKESGMYKDSYAVSLEVEGKQKVVFGSTVLTDKIASSGINKGQMIRIIYKGKRKNQAGTHEYKDYEVWVQE